MNFFIHTTLRISFFYFLFFIFYLPSFAQTELTVTINVGDTILTLSGKTSPSAQVTIVESGAVVGTTTADSAGNFSKSLLAQTPGVHSIGIYSADTNGFSTSTVTYSVSLTVTQETTLSNIILPPTISLSASEIAKGNSLGISGLAVPSSTITLFISSNTVTKTTTSDSNGAWSYSFGTGDLDQGDHSVYAKVTTTAGYQSEPSKTITFKVNPPVSASPAAAASTAPVSSLAPTSPSPTSIFTPLLARLLPAPLQEVIPAIVAIFDLDGSGRIELTEVFGAVKAWVEDWRVFLTEEIAALEEGRLPSKEIKKCDLNRDQRCNLVDLSILLYYVGK